MGILPVLPTDVEIIVIIMAIAYTAISIAVQRLLTNPKRMREIQAKVQTMQKDMNDMMKRNAPQEQLAAKQREFMPLLGEQMKNSMKPLFIIFPMLLAVYYVIIPHIPIIPASMVANTKSFFFIIVLIMGIASAVVVLLYDRQKGKTEKAQREALEKSANTEQPNTQ